MMRSIKNLPVSAIDQYGKSKNVSSDQVSQHISAVRPG